MIKSPPYRLWLRKITGNELGAWRLFACALSLYNFARRPAQHWKHFTSVDCWVLPKTGYRLQFLSASFYVPEIFCKAHPRKEIGRECDRDIDRGRLVRVFDSREGNMSRWIMSYCTSIGYRYLEYRRYRYLKYRRISEDIPRNPGNRQTPTDSDTISWMHWANKSYNQHTTYNHKEGTMEPGKEHQKHYDLEY